jgi:5-methylthioadenosine/S-adenosylhomocysteine deaminase
MPTPCDLLLCASCVVTQNPAREIIDNGAVAISSGRIAAVGPRSRITAAFVPNHTIDLGRAMLLPGLVNVHTHAAMTLFRGLADDLPVTVWLTEHIWPAERRLTPEAVLLGARAACAEMLASGTTCFADLYFFAAEPARAADATGMRAVVGEGVLDFPTPSAASPGQALDLTRDLFASLRGIRACGPWWWPIRPTRPRPKPCAPARTTPGPRTPFSPCTPPRGSRKTPTA